MMIDAMLHSSSLPRIETELLLGHVLQKSRAWIYAHPETVISKCDADAYRTLISRREQHEPMAYIIGEKEFFGHKFMVTRDTLIPRRATEGLIEVTHEFLRTRRCIQRTIDREIVAIAESLSRGDIGCVLDVGTGSGCIIITLALSGMPQSLIGIDISAAAINVAKQNAQKLGVSKRVSFRIDDGIKVIEEMTIPFLVVSNPPYISSGTSLERSVQEFEPHSALFAGAEGTDVLLPLISAARRHSLCRGCIVECTKSQAERLNAHI